MRDVAVVVAMKLLFVVKCDRQQAQQNSVTLLPVLLGEGAGLALSRTSLRLWRVSASRRSVQCLSPKSSAGRDRFPPTAALAAECRVEARPCCRGSWRREGATTSRSSRTAGSSRDLRRRRTGSAQVALHREASRFAEPCSENLEREPRPQFSGQ